jgi:hypothetical protein
MILFVPPLIGLALLLAGYRYYWLIAGGLGFLLGINIVATANEGQLTAAAVSLGLLFGLIGAIAAAFITNFALTAIGFIIGGMVLVGLFSGLAWDPGSNLVLFLFGGFLGWLLTLYALDYARILISAVLGASILLASIPPLDPTIVPLATLVLVVVSIVIQFVLRTKWK